MSTGTLLPTRVSSARSPTQPTEALAGSGPSHYRQALQQAMRFGMVGVLNTAIDVLALNLLIWLFAVHSVTGVVIANAAAYCVGAVNSFALNKRWTFRKHSRISAGEAWRFVGTTVVGSAVNDLLFWLLVRELFPLAGATPLWTTAAKVASIAGSVMVSYVAMRFWVFAQRAPAPTGPAHARSAVRTRSPRVPLTSWADPAAAEGELPDGARQVLTRHSLSVVLPAYNEQEVIAGTVAEIASVLDRWGARYELLVVNDGSTDGTAQSLADCAAHIPALRVLTHPLNRGYGAALNTGFAAATCDLTLFLDADGQFTIADLAVLLPYAERYDAVLGYRVRRRDSPLRLLNAWGWQQLVWLTLGVRVRDLDCAFKLLRTDFLHTHPLSVGSALINAELLYTLQRAGAAYCEVPVHHLPRRAGHATGANPRVILRAVSDLTRFAWHARRRSSAGRLPH